MSDIDMSDTIRDTTSMVEKGPYVTSEMKEYRFDMIMRMMAVGVIVSLTFLSITQIDRCRPFSDAGEEVWFRPPGVVFSVVWPLLYVSTGLAWVKSTSAGKIVDVYFIMLIGLMCLWIISFQCFETVLSKSLSLVILVSSAILSIILLSKSSIAMLPLSVWLSFASLLSIADFSVFLKR
jgi:tryptophan-rich sensory protein